MPQRFAPYQPKASRATMLKPKRIKDIATSANEERDKSKLKNG